MSASLLCLTFNQFIFSAGCFLIVTYTTSKLTYGEGLEIKVLRPTYPHLSLRQTLAGAAEWPAVQSQLMHPVWDALRRRDRCLLIRPLRLNPDRPLGHLLTQRELVLTSLNLLSLHDGGHCGLSTRTAGLKRTQQRPEIKSQYVHDSKQ